ncbi:hypothetical protein niasHT_002587 [Heterodera trifolii]|uniref:Uncharacterized protein n=1 Tax=Heterodera trifolii TaxID=157864 RepID=A0ABD2M0H3_9BILA
MRLLFFPILCFFFPNVLQNTFGDEEKQQFLECFSCDGPCNCQIGHTPQKCAIPNGQCYAVKSALTGQVLRKGCAAAAADAGCRTVVELNGWQRCRQCDDGNLCNDEVSDNVLVNDCQMSQIFGAVQSLRDNLKESGMESEAARDSQFINGIDSSSYVSTAANMDKSEFKNVIGTFLERMSPMSSPIGLENDNKPRVKQLPDHPQNSHQFFGQNLAQIRPRNDEFAPSGHRVTFGQEIWRQKNAALSTFSASSTFLVMISILCV